MGAKDGHKTPPVANEVADTAANRFIKKLIVEENMHLVKMASKSGNGQLKSGLTLQKFQNRIHSSMAEKGQRVDHNIDILSLKQSNRPMKASYRHRQGNLKNSSQSPNHRVNLNRSQHSPPGIKNYPERTKTSPSAVKNFTASRLNPQTAFEKNSQMSIISLDDVRRETSPDQFFNYQQTTNYNNQFITDEKN